MKYASFKMWIADKYHYKEGYAIWLVVRKNNKRKVMALGIYAEPHQWNDKLEMFVTDKRVPKLHPDRNAIKHKIGHCPKFCVNGNRIQL